MESDKKHEMKTRNAERLARAACWAGTVLDALAFLQMAFPSIGRAMMRISAPLSDEYRFAIYLGAGLMLAWTVLLVWAQARIRERWAILPMTMIIIPFNAYAMSIGLGSGLVPAGTAAPMLAAMVLIFALFGAGSVAMLHARRDGAEKG